MRTSLDRFPHPEVVEKLRTEADYFEGNAERMRYPKFRRQHLLVGSGVIEAGCKTIACDAAISTAGSRTRDSPSRRKRFCGPRQNLIRMLRSESHLSQHGLVLHDPR